MSNNVATLKPWTQCNKERIIRVQSRECYYLPNFSPLWNNASVQPVLLSAKVTQADWCMPNCKMLTLPNTCSIFRLPIKFKPDTRKTGYAFTSTNPFTTGIYMRLQLLITRHPSPSSFSLLSLKWTKQTEKWLHCVSASLTNSLTHHPPTHHLMLQFSFRIQT